MLLRYTCRRHRWWLHQQVIRKSHSNMSPCTFRHRRSLHLMASSLSSRRRRTFLPRGLVRTRRSAARGTRQLLTAKKKNNCSNSDISKHSSPSGPIPKTSEPEGLGTLVLKTAVGLMGIIMGSRMLLLVLRGAPLMTVLLTPAGMGTTLGIGIVAYAGHRAGWFKYHRLMIPIGVGGVLVAILSSVMLRDLNQSNSQILRQDALKQLRDRSDGVWHEIGFETRSVDSMMMLGQQTMRAKLRARHTSQTHIYPERLDYDLIAVRDHPFQPWRLISLLEEQDEAAIAESM